MSSKSRARANSNWGSITILGDNGEPLKLFKLDKLGQLADKMPRQRRRDLKGKLQDKIVTPVVLEQRISAPVIPVVGSVSDSNKVTLDSHIATGMEQTEPETASFETCGLDSAGDSYIYPEYLPSFDECYDFGLDLWSI